MFNVQPMPPSIPRETLDLLLETDTGTIGHFRDRGFMDAGIAPRLPGRKIAGTAVTLKLTVPDSVMAHYALKHVRPGDVLVIERGADQHVACWGGSTYMAAAAAGVAGVIIDGAGNDLSFAHAANLAVWCRSITPITTKYLGIGGELNVPVVCGGITVTPGNAILADENGVFVLDSADIATIAEQARPYHVRERAYLQTLAAEGYITPYPDITGATAIVEAALARR